MLSIKKYNKTNTMKYRTEAAGVTVHTENNRNEAHCNDKEDIFTLLHTYTLKRTLKVVFHSGKRLSKDTNQTVSLLKQFDLCLR